MQWVCLTCHLCQVRRCFVVVFQLLKFWGVFLYLYCTIRSTFSHTIILKWILVLQSAIQLNWIATYWVVRQSIKCTPPSPLSLLCSSCKERANKHQIAQGKPNRCGTSHHCGQYRRCFLGNWKIWCELLLGNYIYKFVAPMVLRLWDHQ